MIPDHIAHLMTASACLAHLSDEVKHILYDGMQIRHLKRGEFLHYRGDEASGYYGIIRGRLRASAVSEDGKPMTLCFMEQGQWFGEISLVDGVARTHDCEAVTDSEVYVIPKTLFERYILEDHSALKYLAKQLCERLRFTLDWVEQSTLMPPPARLARRLLDLMPNQQNTIQINQQELAQMLGLSRQSISKILQDWVQKNWIEIDYNRITLTQFEQLQNLCASERVPQSRSWQDQGHS